VLYKICEAAFSGAERHTGPHVSFEDMDKDQNLENIRVRWLGSLVSLTILHEVASAIFQLLLTSLTSISGLTHVNTKFRTWDEAGMAGIIL
jgi:hypothetical protein